MYVGVFVEFFNELAGYAEKVPGEAFVEAMEGWVKC